MLYEAQTDRIYQSIATNHRTRRSDEIRVSYRDQGELAVAEKEGPKHSL